MVLLEEGWTVEGVSADEDTDLLSALSVCVLSHPLRVRITRMLTMVVTEGFVMEELQAQ